MDFPIEFIERMKRLLGSDFNKFTEALDNPPFKALRVNLLKTNSNILKNHFSFINEPTPFCNDSYYIPQDVSKLGNHPLHHSGAFYLQEPSAACVVEALGIEEGDIVLDMCASPGGKSTQAASKLQNKGLLVSNEFVSSRVKPLCSNIERMGITNAVVTSLRPDVLAEKLPMMFNKVIVDAPCSGEGMFRKESAAIENWSVENVLACAERQLKILNSAAKCVAPGGKMVYSTCTYSYEENEQTVFKFLQQNPDFHLVPVQHQFGTAAFNKNGEMPSDIALARRIFNFNGGEGHFAAVFEREGTFISCFELNPNLSKRSKEIDLFFEFFKQNFESDIPQNVILNNNNVYIVPVDILKYGVKPVVNGIFAGVCKNGRFVPEHALFNNHRLVAKNVINLSIDSKELKKYLHGEEIECDNSLKGYTQIRCENIALGFGKASNGVLKNHYPKGLRTL